MSPAVRPSETRVAVTSQADGADNPRSSVSSEDDPRMTVKSRVRRHNMEAAIRYGVGRQLTCGVGLLLAIAFRSWSPEAVARSPLQTAAVEIG